MPLLPDIIRRVKDMTLPPPRDPDTELVDSAILTTRALTKADRALDKRRRLNAELTRAEEQIRTNR